MSEQRTGPVRETSSQQPKDLPIPPAIDAIRRRSIADIGIRASEGRLLTPEERLFRDVRGEATDDIRAQDQVLSLLEPEQMRIIDATYANSYKLKAWMDARGLSEYDDGSYHLEKDLGPRTTGKLPPERRAIDLQVASPDFELSYALFYNGTYDFRINFNPLPNGQVPYYRSGIKPLRGSLTTEDAEIIGFYALNFLDTHQTAQRPAA